MKSYIDLTPFLQIQKISQYFDEEDSFDNDQPNGDRKYLIHFQIFSNDTYSINIMEEKSRKKIYAKSNNIIDMLAADFDLRGPKTID